MQNKFIIGMVVSIVSIFAETSYADSNWEPAIILGNGIMHADQSQTLRLNNTPPPGLTNSYVANNTQHGTALLGVSLDKLTNLQIGTMQTRLGMEMDYIRNIAIQGTVAPMVNVAPNFDRLIYVYDLNTLLLQSIVTCIQPDLFKNFDAYLQGGLGLSIIRMSDYREYPPDNSSAAPMLSAFQSKNTLNLGFSAGMGVRQKLLDSNYISLGYKFVFAGQSEFNKSNVEQNNAAISLSSVNYHLLIVTLS